MERTNNAADFLDYSRALKYNIESRYALSILTRGSWLKRKLQYVPVCSGGTVRPQQCHCRRHPTPFSFAVRQALEVPSLVFTDAHQIVDRPSQKSNS